MVKLTTKGFEVIPGKIYHIQYRWGDGYRNGYGRICPDADYYNDGYVDIICAHGGVTIIPTKEVIFLRQMKQ